MEDPNEILTTNMVLVDEWIGKAYVDQVTWLVMMVYKLWLSRNYGLLMLKVRSFSREYAEGVHYLYRRQNLITRRLHLTANNKCSTNSTPG
jgi:hypothetical protein